MIRQMFLKALSFLIIVMMEFFMLTGPAFAVPVSGCFGIYVTCLDVSMVHSSLRTIVNALVDGLVGDYQDWWLDTWWTDGVLRALPPMQAQLTLTTAKTTEMKSTFTTHQTQNDAMSTINRQKARGVISQLPSEMLCTFATLSGGLVAAEADGKKNLGQSMNFMRSLATGDSSMVDGSALIQTKRNDSLCKYADPDVGNGAITALCSGSPPPDVDQDLAFVGYLSTKNSFGPAEQTALNSAVQGMFFPKRPPAMNPALLDNDIGRVAFVNARSVTSREMLGAYCFLKTYQDRMGGDTTAQPYHDVALSELGMSPAESVEFFGGGSARAQRQVMLMKTLDPTFGIKLHDTPENSLRIANGVQSQTVSRLYDNLEMINCNQMMSGQMLTDAVLDMGSEVQEEMDALRYAVDQRERKKNEFVQTNTNHLSEFGEK